MSPKLSIITINYNDAQGLSKTMESVFGQSCQDFEYIVIDGESKDGSKEIILENDKNIAYAISEPDKGIFNAMNKGIKAAKGEYLLFLNSGDYLYNKEVIGKVIPLLNPKTDIFYGNMVSCENEIPIAFCIPPKILTFSFFLIFSLPHQASFIKKELFFENFMYNESYKIISDWEFFIYNICKKQTPYKHLDITISNFDATGISSNSNNQEKIQIEKEQVLKEHFPLFYQDSFLLKEIKTKRFQQIMQLKQHKSSWGLLKLWLNFLGLFHPKTQTDFTNYYKKI